MEVLHADFFQQTLNLMWTQR